MEMSTPNIILIVMDSARPDHISAYGYDRKTTPHMDAFAEEGTRFTQAVTSAPWTLPSHATLFTGLYPTEHSLMKGTEGANISLQRHFRTLAEILSELGYLAAGFSSNPWVGANTNLDKGFGFYLESDLKVRINGDSRGLSLLPRHTSAVRRAIPLLSKRKVRFFTHAMLTRIVRRSVRRWFEYLKSRRDGRPWFTFINFMDAHQPYFPPRKHLTQLTSQTSRPARKFNRDLDEYYAGTRDLDDDLYYNLNLFYDASLHFLDEQLGLLFEYLRQNALLDNTLIVVMSDHGKTLGEHTRQDLLHYMKDVNLRVPLIVRYPDTFPPGYVCDDEVTLMDVFYMILELLGMSNTDLNLPHERCGLLRALNNQSTGKERVTFSEIVYPFFIDQDVDEEYWVRCARTRSHKYTRSSKDGEMFYDLTRDPWERDNILGQAPADVLSFFREQLTGWEQGLLNYHDNGDSKFGVEDMDARVLERLRNLGYL